MNKKIFALANKNKILISLLVFALAAVPSATFAAFGISYSSPGFSIGIGSGEGVGMVGGYGSGGGWNIGNLAGFGLPTGSIYGIIGNLLMWLLGIFGFVGVIGFVISGIMYLVAAGDEDMIGKAKKAMTYSIIGVVVGLLGVVVIQAINLALNGFGQF